MQPPRSREMQPSGQIGVPELGQNGHHHHQLQQIQNGGAGMQSHFDHAAVAAGHDDFFDQMLSTLPSAWADLGNPKSPWGDLNGSADAAAAAGQELFSIGLAGKSGEGGELQYAPYDDESTLLASRLRQHQISGGGGKGMIQLNPHHAAQQQMLLKGGVVDSGLVPLPLSLGSGGSHNDEGEGLYNGFGASMQHQQQQQQQFHHPQIPGRGGAPIGGGAAAAAPPRQRVRARRGQATDPHSIAERLRRERIAERMKALQELVPNANKADKASMLDEIIEYVKFLQLQVKVLSMSRLGGAAAVAPLVADISSEGGRAAAAAAEGGDSLAVAEHQLAKLMEEDMGSAMQYLQGKGLCLMPISLASAISSATCHPRVGGLLAMQGNGDAPSSPSMSVLTVQSAMANGGGGGANGNKDAASVSKP